MKRTVFIIAIISLLSCSKNEEVEEINPLKEKIVGSWQFVGYVDDWIDPETGSNYHPFENGEIKTFFSNGDFNSLSNSLNYPGDFQVTTDSILTINYFNTISGNPYTSVQRIIFLDNNLMKTDCNIDDSNCPISYFQRITTP